MLGEFRVRGIDPLHSLIRAARAGDTWAVAEVLRRVAGRASALLPPISGGVIVPVPGHLPSDMQPLLGEVAAVLAATREWTVANRALLRRHETPEAKTAPVRDRASEVTSLEWNPPPGETIVLLDDVVRSGTTFQVCADAIRAIGDSRPIVALALARADYRGRT